MKVIITGTTGMVGKGVLLECLDRSEVTAVLSISRRSTGVEHSKLKELIHADFSEFDSVASELGGYDACFACMGVSSMGMDEAKYTKLTYDYTLSLANTLLTLNPSMTFNYVSGQGTDSSEKGRSMWARVKGKTENDLLALGFKQAFAFRPGMIIPMRGVIPSDKNYRRMIGALGWLLRLMKKIAPNSVVDTNQIGQAMIQVSSQGYGEPIINPVDINALAKALP